MCEQVILNEEIEVWFLGLFGLKWGRDCYHFGLKLGVVFFNKATFLLLFFHVLRNAV